MWCCQTSSNNNRLYFKHQSVFLYEWPKFMRKSLNSRRRSISSVYHRNSTNSDIQSYIYTYVVHLTLSNVRLPKCFRIKFTNKSHTSLDFCLSQWKYKLKGPFATGLMSREVVLWTPCFMWVVTQYFKYFPLKMSWGFYIPVLVACLCPFWFAFRTNREKIRLTPIHIN